MRRNIPINSYKTFQYVKSQLEEELKKDEENLKQELVSKVPFGLGDSILNNNGQEGNLKKALTKEALANGLPVIKKIVRSFLINNKTKIIKVGVSAISGLALSLFVGKKLK